MQNIRFQLFMLHNVLYGNVIMLYSGVQRTQIAHTSSVGFKLGIGAARQEKEQCSHTWSKT